MIYDVSGEYWVSYFVDSAGRKPVAEYIDSLDEKDQDKIFKYLELLKLSGGVLDEPYTKHIRGKIRELRVDFWHNRHRIFFFTFVDKNIILLHAFLKTTEKTPEQEIIRAENRYAAIASERKNYER